MGFYLSPDDVAKYIPLFRGLSVWWQLVIAGLVISVASGFAGWRVALAYYRERIHVQQVIIDDYRGKERPQPQSPVQNNARAETGGSGYEKIFWKPLTNEAKAILTSKFRALGVHRVQVFSYDSTDCVSLATDIRRCFELAQWQVRQWPLTNVGIHLPEGDNGIRIESDMQSDVLRRVVRDAIMDATGGPTSGTVDARPPAEVNQWPEIRIVVRPKSARYDL